MSTDTRGHEALYHQHELQTLVYDILPLTTDINDYAAVVLEKLSANEQFFDDAQNIMALSLSDRQLILYQVILSQPPTLLTPAENNKTKIV